MNNLTLATSNSGTITTLVVCVLSLLVAIVSEVFLIYFLLNKFEKPLSKNSSETQEFSDAENPQNFSSGDKNTDVEENLNKQLSNLKNEPSDNESKTVFDDNSNKLRDDFSAHENQKNDKTTCPFLPKEEVEKIFNDVFGLSDTGAYNASFNSDATALSASDETLLETSETTSSIVAPDTAVSETDENIFSADGVCDVVSTDKDYVREKNFEPEILEPAIVAPETAVADGLQKPFAAPFIDNAPNIRYLRSFTAKLCQSNDLLKERYSSVKNELLSYGKVKSRTSWFFETFRVGNIPLAKFAINGKTLSLYLALSPQALSGTKYHFNDVSQYKKYAAVPLRMKIKSNRSVRWAKELIAIMASEYNLVKLNRDEVDYYPEYRDLEELILAKEIKIEYTGKTTFSASEENSEYNSEGIVIGEVATTASDCGNVCTQKTPAHAGERPMAIIAECDIDSLNDDEETVAEENEKGTFLFDSADDSESLGKVAKTSDVEDLTALKGAYKTDDIQASVSADDGQPKESSEPPQEEEVLPLLERDFEISSAVSVTKAEKTMEDAEAESLVETIAEAEPQADKYKSYSVGTAQAIINVDTLSKNYSAGETVTLDSLKAKKLLPKKVGYVKVLARGIIDKPLCVEADEFSLSAVKMILLTGGRAIRTPRKSL